jgi:hypothetical protein
MGNLPNPGRGRATGGNNQQSTNKKVSPTLNPHTFFELFSSLEFKKQFQGRKK